MARAWIKFKLIERPYCDDEGKILSADDLKNRKNRPGIDAFHGGGKVYPDVGALKVLSWQEKGPTLMLLLEGEDVALTALSTKADAVTYEETPGKEKQVPYTVFVPARIKDFEALAVLKTDIGLPAGVTLDENLKPIFPEQQEGDK